MAHAVRVLEIIDDANIGGGQRHVLMLAEQLRHRGFDISVACDSEGYLVEELRKRNILMYPVRLRNRLGARSLSTLYGICKSRRFQIVHSHGGTAGFWGRVAAFLAGVPVRIQTYHGLHTLHRKGIFVKFLFLIVERLLVSVTTKFICVSEADFRLAGRKRLLTNEKAVVVRNGIETKKYANTRARKRIRAEFNISDQHIFVGTVGRLHTQKGQRYLLDAIPRVLKVNPHVRFVIVGSGNLWNKLRNKASTMGIREAVFFTGVRYDVPELLSAMDIYVLQSLWEGLALTLLEACAAGKPIVATAIDGNKEIVRHGFNGLLVPERDPEALACAILELVKNKPLRSKFARNGRRIVKKEYEVKRMVSAIAEVYNTSLHPSVKLESKSTM